MKKVGLIGEAPNDTYAIKNLLNQKLSDKIVFFEMIRNIRGSNLDNQKTKHRLRKNYEREKPDFIILIRDLDALENDKTKLKLRKDYFTQFNKVIDKTGIFLLNIYEIEAIILADMNNFNKYYDIELSYIGDPMETIEPKEFLMENSKYKESDCPELFRHLEINTVINNCRYFKTFYNKFSKLIENEQ